MPSSPRIRFFFIAAVAIIAVGLSLYVHRQPGSDPALPGSGPRLDIRNVVLISIDTCRADHLSCYGYPRKITPHIDAVAARGFVCDHAVSPATLTLPAHATMLTGTNPPYHGIYDNSGYQLAPFNVTLAETLKQQGFICGAAIGTVVLDSQYGLNQGFDWYHDEFDSHPGVIGVAERRGEEVNRYALQWLEQHRNERFFLFVHYYDPHIPYAPPQPFKSQAAEDAHPDYAGEVAYTDHCVGQVTAKLAALGLSDSTLVIITSDHGEMLGAHEELFHGYFIYQDVVRVPLIIKLPGERGGKRIGHPVGLVDLVATVCGLLGADPPSPMHGIDLSPWLTDRPAKMPQRYLYCQSFLPTEYNAAPLAGVVTKRWKYISTARPELYDLLRDPLEARNLVQQLPDRAQLLHSQLKRLVAEQYRPEASAAMQIDEQSRQLLESIGYVGGDGVKVDFDFDDWSQRDDPKELATFNNRNWLLFDMIANRKYGQARDLCEAMIRQRPGFLTGRIHLARIAMAQGDWAVAEEHLNKAIELRPDHLNAHNYLGRVLASQQRFDEAIEHLRQALAINPDHVASHHHLGILLKKLNRTDAAIEHYRHALGIKPNYVKLRIDLGVALWRQGKRAEAIDELRRAVTTTPNNAVAQYNLGWMLSQVGSNGEAVGHYDQAIQLEMQTPDLLIQTAWILATHQDEQVRRPQRAVQLAKRAAALTNHGNAAVLDVLAAALAAAQRYEHAVQTAESALELATASGPTSLLEPLKRRLELYRRGRPYREPVTVKPKPLKP